MAGTVSVLESGSKKTAEKADPDTDPDTDTDPENPHPRRAEARQERGR
jgi:hypothetical protein